MKLYLSIDHGERIILHTVFKAAQQASMWIEAEHQHGSRYADVSRVIEFNGYGSESVHSNMRPNTRDAWVRSNMYAATWDQWGVMLSCLFTLDPDMKVGSYKHPYYDGREDFHRMTDGRYRDVTALSDLTDYHGDHSWTFWQPRGQQCRKCSARRVYGA